MIGWKDWWRLVVGVLLVALPMQAWAGAETASKVYLNGVPTPVFFNDGDSFRVLAGPLKDSTARLSGFNTLESYGATQRWGDWHAKELYFLAKMATTNARRGVWHCTSDLKKDGYGRVLWFCPDLGQDQIRKGLAHVMVVGREAPDPEFMKAQKEAIEARRGIWAHGAPEFVVTSTHSASENWEGGRPYNRIVSTRDGKSLKWEHADVYKECQEVCFSSFAVPAELSKAAIVELRGRANLKQILDGYSDEQLSVVINGYARTGIMPDMQDAKHAQALEPELQAMRQKGQLGTPEPGEVSCMTYTDFRRRFGEAQAPCLK